MTFRCVLIAAILLGVGLNAREASAVKVRVYKRGISVGGFGKHPGWRRYPPGTGKYVNKVFREMGKQRKSQWTAAQKLMAQQMEAQRLAAEKKQQQRQAAADAARSAKERERERFKARQAAKAANPEAAKTKTPSP